MEAEITDLAELLRKFECAEGRAAENCKLGPRIQLNIGGQRYTTSIQTLTSVPGSMLAAMFSGRFSLAPDEDGAYFIDRDGTHFRYILNYLRGRVLPVLQDDVVRVELFREAHFYGLDELCEALARNETDVNDQLKDIVASHSSVVDMSLAEPDVAQTTGFFSADKRLSWVRGYEVCPSHSCRVGAVHVYMKMSAGKKGRVLVFNSSAALTATGSYFYGPGQNWFESEFNPPLVMEAQQSYVVLADVDDGLYFCVSHGGNPQTGRTCDIFMVYGRSCPTAIIHGPSEQIRFDSNKFNLLMRIVRLP